MPRRTLALFAISTCFLQAQEFRSTLTGKITDPSGASVAGANVVAIKSDTNSKYQTLTNAEGLYTLPLLTPGAYELTADASGFKKYVQSGIQIGSDTRSSTATPRFGASTPSNSAVRRCCRTSAISAGSTLRAVTPSIPGHGSRPPTQPPRRRSADRSRNSCWDFLPAANTISMPNPKTTPGTTRFS